MPRSSVTSRWGFPLERRTAQGNRRRSGRLRDEAEAGSSTTLRGPTTRRAKCGANRPIQRSCGQRNGQRVMKVRARWPVTHQPDRTPSDRARLAHRQRVERPRQRQQRGDADENQRRVSSAWESEMRTGCPSANRRWSAAVIGIGDIFQGGQQRVKKAPEIIPPSMRVIVDAAPKELAIPTPSATAARPQAKDSPGAPPSSAPAEAPKPRRNRSRPRAEQAGDASGLRKTD